MKGVILLAASCLFLVVAAPSQGQPQPQTSTSKSQLNAQPQELRAGESVTVSGFGCASGNHVRFDLYNPRLSSSAETVAKTDGTFVQSIQIPTTTKVGRTWLQATCLTVDSQQQVMEAVLLIGRPLFVITWVNVAFGLGTVLVVFGLGLLMFAENSRKRPA